MKYTYSSKLDPADINAWILYKETIDENISRKDFLFQLADGLVTGNASENVKPAME